MASKHRREHISSIEIDSTRARIAFLRESYSSGKSFSVRSTRSSSSIIEDAGDEYENDIRKCISSVEHSILGSSVGDEGLKKI
ncbi:hypothetical protein CsSME_00045823 [Camellia sinensis var. sinensis]